MGERVHKRTPAVNVVIQSLADFRARIAINASEDFYGMGQP